MDIAYGMSATFLFDTLMVVVFPILGRFLGLSDAAFGLWAGTAAVSYTHLDVYKRQAAAFIAALMESFVTSLPLTTATRIVVEPVVTGTL